MRIERISSQAELQNKRPFWEKVQTSAQNYNIFLSSEWISCWSRYFSPAGTLSVLIFFDQNDDPAGIAPLQHIDNKLCFLAGRDVTDYCDFIFPADQAESLFKALLLFIKKEFPGIHSLELINIPESSPTLIHLNRLAPDFGFSVLLQESEVVPILALPDSYAEYEAGLARKNRHELRRKLRRFERLADFKITSITAPEMIRTAIDAFIELHRSGGPDKSLFWEKPGMSDFFQDIASNLAKNGQAELNLLQVENRLLAGQFNFLSADTVYLYNTAFSQEYADLSPGIYLFDFRIKKAINEKRNKMNFLRGREKYKYYFGAQDSKIFDLTLGLNMEDL